MPTETPNGQPDDVANGAATRPSGTGGEGTPSALAPGRFRYSTRTRLAVVAVLIVAAGAFAVAGMSTVTGDTADLAVTGTPGDGGGTSPATGVESRQPGPGAEIPGQQAIGIDLAPGWTGEVELRRADGAGVLSTEDFEVIEELDVFRYQPQPGRRIERLSGDYCLVATIWDRTAGRAATEAVDRWCFTAF